MWIYCYLLNGIGLEMDLNNSCWIWKYLTLLLNNINIWFFTLDHIWPKEIELDSVWTILLEILNYTEEWENILNVLLVYVTMTCETQSYRKITVMWMNYVNYVNYCLTDNSRKPSYVCNGIPAWLIN